MKDKNKKMCSKNKMVIRTRSDFDEFVSESVHHLEMIKRSLEACLVVEEKSHPTQNKYVEAGAVPLIEEIEEFIEVDHCHEEHCFVFDKIGSLLNRVKSFKKALGGVYSYDA